MAGTVSTLGVGVSALLSTLQNPVETPLLNRQNFLPFFISGRDRVSSTSEVITLKPLELVSIRNYYDENSRKGLWSVLILQPQLQIARSYTPIPPSLLPPTNTTDIVDSDQLRFLIRHHPGGEVSSYVRRLDVCDTIYLRGPYIEYEIPDGVKEVLFLAGGTGIAPALQAIHTLFHVRGGEGRTVPNVNILWANKKREDCEGGVRDSEGPRVNGVAAWLKKLLHVEDKKRATTTNTATAPTPIVQELECLKKKHPGKINVDYFVDEEGTTITESVLLRYLEEQSMREPGAGIKLILISGPDGFIAHYAGPKHWMGGLEQQGPLGGMLEGVGVTGWQVWKL
ncbi:MAG: hypothetical protein Q9187_007931 [Circinaria calcarea]